MIHPHYQPNPPQELQIFKHLASRTNLSIEEKLNFEKLCKGYEGEVEFYQVVKDIAL